MAPARDQTEANFRLYVGRLTGWVGPRTLPKPKTTQATIGYAGGRWVELGYMNDRECDDAFGDDAANLIVLRPGSNRTSEIFVLGAHNDTVFSTPGAVNERKRGKRRGEQSLPRSPS